MITHGACFRRNGTGDGVRIVALGTQDADVTPVVVYYHFATDETRVMPRAKFEAEFTYVEERKSA